MKSIVVYFSQTGNTRQIAGAIQAGINGSSGECDLVRIQDVSNDDLLRYDLIGLGSPVWHRREPANVLGFIEYNMKSLEGRHAFTFCTHGLYPGHFIGRVVPTLRLEGLTVVGWKSWYCSVWLPEYPKPYFTDGHPDEIDLQEARDFGQEMSDRSRRLYEGETNLVPDLPVGREYHELYPGPGSTDRAGRSSNPEGSLDMIDLRSFDFKVNKEKCNYPQCMVCIDNCPTASINFSVSPPLFRKNCDRCFFCEQICPRGAIEVDWRPLADFVDKNVIDSWVAVAEEAVASGRLRQLVPPEEVGLKTPWYMVKKPPRLKPL